VVSNHTVLLLTVWLARWRCKRCRYVFTDYPDFRTSL
jgi:transposase-like protein